MPKAAIAPKITQALAELGISHSRLVMPTRENCAHLESLLEATTALVETKRVADKVDYDIQVLKDRLGRRASQGADGESHENSGNGSTMDVDETERAEGEIEGDGRAQSVVSTRSARSRKHVSAHIYFLNIWNIILVGHVQPRRSMSISSVDTSISTRAATKRQKRS